MEFKDYFTGKKVEKAPELPERVKGTIYVLNSDKGWGFIESELELLKFERIYFNWKGLNSETLKFNELKRGMNVEFTPRKYVEKDKVKWTAIKVEVE